MCSQYRCRGYKLFLEQINQLMLFWYFLPAGLGFCCVLTGIWCPSAVSQLDFGVLLLCLNWTPMSFCCVSVLLRSPAVSQLESGVLLLYLNWSRMSFCCVSTGLQCPSAVSQLDSGVLLLCLNWTPMSFCCVSVLLRSPAVSQLESGVLLCLNWTLVSFCCVSTGLGCRSAVS